MVAAHIDMEKENFAFCLLALTLTTLLLSSIN